MTYSKEVERQNQALGDILAGRKSEKKVMVGYKGKDKEEGNIIPEMTELMRGVRMPWFCPVCDSVMNRRLDNKIWTLFGHCFDCQIKIENKLRILGKYKEWEVNKMKENKISFIKDTIQKIEEWKDMKAPEWFNRVGVNYPELEKEKWSVDVSRIKQMAEEAIKEYTEVLEDLEK